MDKDLESLITFKINHIKLILESIEEEKSDKEIISYFRQIDLLIALRESQKILDDALCDFKEIKGHS